MIRGLGQNAGIIAAAGVASCAIVIGAAVLVPSQQAETPTDVSAAAAPVAAVTATPDSVDTPTVEETTAETDVVDNGTAQTAPTIQPPVREEFLMFPDGFATIAGKADAGVTVDVIVAGETMERVVADANGNFGATLFIAPSDQPRVMRLISDPEGAAVASAETYFVQPTLLAASEPEATPAAEQAIVPENSDVAGLEPAETPEVVEDVAAPEVDADVAVAGDVAADTADVVAEVEQSDAPDTTDTAEDVVSVVEDSASDADTLPEQVASASEEITAEITDVTPDTSETAAELSDAAEVTSDASQDAANEIEVVVAETVETAPSKETTPQTEAATTEAATTEPASPEPATTELVTNADVTETATPETPAAPAVLVADADGVRVLQPALSDTSPEVMSNVALDTITYDNTGEVLIAGRALGEGSVQVYLDNQPITTTLIDEQGNWRTDLPDVDTGVYTLRIDEIASDGDVVSRIETPFQREEAEDVAAVFAEDNVDDETFEVAVRTVQPGATLWAIAREQFGSGVMYVAVFEANKDRIRDPDLIYPGQVFRIPAATE